MPEKNMLNYDVPAYPYMYIMYFDHIIPHTHHVPSTPAEAIYARPLPKLSLFHFPSFCEQGWWGIYRRIDTPRGYTTEENVSPSPSNH